MSRYYEVCQRWVERNTGDPTAREMSTQRVFYRGRSIFSYGSHFEMARSLRDAKGDHSLFLVNGDTFSSSTTNHQGHLRDAIGSMPSVIIPFTALQAAGIDLDTVEVIHRTADRHEEIHHESRELPPRAQWFTRDVMKDVALTLDEIRDRLTEIDVENVEEWEGDQERGREEQAYFDEHGRFQYGSGLWIRHLDDPMPEPATLTDLWRKGHWYHTTPMPADWVPTEHRKVGEERYVAFTGPHGRGGREIEVCTDEDGPYYTWTTTRHWLGGSLIRARVDWVQARRCRVCRGTGRDPEPLHGPLILDDEWMWRLQGGCGACRSRGTNLRSGRRWAYFLSSFDANESRPSYFFCELPRGPKPTTIEEAYEVLKPDPVRLAEQMGRTVHRQGDIFAIELSAQITRRTLRKQGAVFERRGSLLGTNHAATEVARMPDGTTVVRGSLRHIPDRRRPDHAMVKLGDGKRFHVVIKNTVPVAA